MDLIHFMCHECGWTFQLCDGANLGVMGQIREQQIKFKAPHPLNLIAPHLMIQLRQIGSVEVLGANTNGIYAKLTAFFTSSVWSSTSSTSSGTTTAPMKQMIPDRRFSDLKFVGEGVFKSRGTQGENNMGQKTMQVVDFMVKGCGWTVITCNGGNCGVDGTNREQQLVFRYDEHCQVGKKDSEGSHEVNRDDMIAFDGKAHGEEHMMVELRTCGHIEINGLDFATADIAPALDQFLKSKWGCFEMVLGGEGGDEKYCDKTYATQPNFFLRDERNMANNLGKLTMQLAEFYQSVGWKLLLCNGGSVGQPGHANTDIREQQIKFCRGKKDQMDSIVNQPLLMIELRIVPVSLAPNKGEIPEPLYEGYVTVNGKDTNNVYAKIRSFIVQTLELDLSTGGGVPPPSWMYCDLQMKVKGLRMKDICTNPRGGHDGYFNGETNLGKWTMRLCDYLVDQVNEWDLIVCNSDNLDKIFDKIVYDKKSGKRNVDKINATVRETQIVFRHRRNAGRAVFMGGSDGSGLPLNRPPHNAIPVPVYWSPECKEGREYHKIVVGTSEEKIWLQQILDETFKNVKTRDRAGGQKIADRYEVQMVLRSEHPALWDKFSVRGETVRELCKNQMQFLSGGEIGEETGTFVRPKTMRVEEAKKNCAGKDFDATNMNYLLHGTHPTMAVSILGKSFSIDTAGKSAGTMFGPGIYLAESSTKADEYARHDEGGEYEGLYAMLVCRAHLGRSYVTEKSGDFRQPVLSENFDHVLGDREKAVGTFREFVFFHEGSIYPEYALFYKRTFGGDVMKPTPATAAAVTPVTPQPPVTTQVQPIVIPAAQATIVAPVAVPPAATVPDPNATTTPDPTTAVNQNLPNVPVNNASSATVWINNDPAGPAVSSTPSAGATAGKTGTSHSSSSSNKSSNQS